MILFLLRVVTIFIVTAPLALAGQPDTTSIYKWQDASGIWHYGNTQPANDAGYATTTLDKHGLVVQQKAAAPTEKERAALAARALEEKKRLEAQIAQQRYDNALLGTYTSAAEIDLARDHNLALIQLVINGIKSRLEPLLATRADILRESGNRIPTTGENAIDYQDNARRINALNAQLMQKKQEYADTNLRYHQAKIRFLQLTGDSNTTPPPY